MVMDKIKDLYPNEDEGKLRIYLDIGISLVSEHLSNLNIELDNSKIIEKYENALVLFLINAIDNSKDKNVSTKKQGNKSITYTNNRKFLALTSEVKSLLPSCPRIKVMG